MRERKDSSGLTNSELNQLCGDRPTQGKGSKPRKHSRKKYEEGYDNINWGRSQVKYAEDTANNKPKGDK